MLSSKLCGDEDLTTDNIVRRRNSEGLTQAARPDILSVLVLGALTAETDITDKLIF